LRYRGYAKICTIKGSDRLLGRRAKIAVPTINAKAKEGVFIEGASA
jgi:hypothetical protein